MRYFVGILAMVVLFWSSPLAAEGNCPSGFYPIGGQGVSGCAPIPGAVAGTASPSAPPPAQPLGEWLTRWGAVAESLRRISSAPQPMSPASGVRWM